MRAKPRIKYSWNGLVLATLFSLIFGLSILIFSLMVFDPLHGRVPDVPPLPQDYLAEQCDIHGCDFALLDAIVFCESGWRMVKNPKSSAFGYFQIIDATEMTTLQYQNGQRKFDPYTNIDMGVYLYTKQGTAPWNESKSCWQRRYPL